MNMKALNCCLVVVLFAAAAAVLQVCHGDPGYRPSRATYYGSPDCLGTAIGACGFGPFGKNVNGGNVAGVSALYRNGTGCGTCYQVRCTDAQVCSPDGVNLVVTDYGQGDRTDFVMSPRAYTSMALSTNSYAAQALISRGVVDIEYRRISCQYAGYNVVVKVDESSKNPEYLALVPLYVGGKRDVVGMEVSVDGSQEWRSMCRNHGAVWDIVSPPCGGPLRLRVRLALEGYEVADGKWVVLGNPIPASWSAGAYYDAGLQLSSDD